jgi:glycosyltransferase involved in cell wall biosynthesis
VYYRYFIDIIITKIGVDGMDTPLISVIIPTFNRGIYITKTIKSVMAQTYKNIEVVIVDDGSTDNTEDLVNQLEVKYNKIKYYKQQNQGVSAARNYGIDKSTGKYIAFLDSDDLWHINKLQRQMAKLLEEDADACFCGTIKIYENDKSRETLKNNFDLKKPLISQLMLRNDAQTITWLIRKDVIENCNIRFSSKYSYAEDWEFYCKIMAVSKVTCVNEYLAYYIIHSNTLTSNFGQKKQELEMWEDFKIWLNENSNRLKYNTLEIEKTIDNFLIPYRIMKWSYDINSLGLEVPRWLIDKYHLINNYKVLTVKGIILYLSIKFSFINRLVKIIRNK